MFQLELDLEPVAEGRPRFRRLNTRCHRCGASIMPNVSTYTPEETANYKKYVAFQAALANKGRPLLAGPLGLKLDVFVGNKSGPKVTRWCDKRPDADNYQKSVMDALNHVVYTDDGQVAYTETRKLYRYRKPGIQLEVWPLEPMK